MFRLTTITKNLLIINVLMFIATWVFSRKGIYDLNNILGLHFILAPNFSIYQLFTYMFMHANFEHLFFNMFALWMFGCVVENVLGSKRFLIYYIICGIGAGVIQEVAQFGSFYVLATEQFPGFSAADIMILAHNSSGLLSTWTTVGASGAIYAVLLAFGMIFPNERIFIFPLPIPIKAKWFVGIYIIVELFSALATTNDSVAHFAHLGGMLFGYFLIRYWRNHPGGGNYGRNRGQQFFDNLKNNWERRSNRKADNAKRNDTQRRESDWEYNAKKKADMDEIDRILDKVRRSGYDSLTEEEKKKLFDGSDS
ncbi:MAG: rhomboid family intramembrane serine protease [Prevotella sp.]|nr:rhomboid family intramembrane serine protease [Prevotella sp.]